MALLERVSTLLRANLNDLIDKAEDPQKLLRQLVLDMENQLMQVKTQVAIAIADQHLLEKKRKEHMDSAAEWRSKAGLAVRKGDDDLARAALERSLSQDQIAKGFSQQLEDQQAEADTLRTALPQAGPEVSGDAQPLRAADRAGPQDTDGEPGDRGPANHRQAAKLSVTGANEVAHCRPRGA